MFGIPAIHSRKKYFLGQSRLTSFLQVCSMKAICAGQAGSTATHMWETYVHSAHTEWEL